ncbi:hypothetical protein C0Q70_04905 [Pomacea canaliculata]|uniref:Uncharacterized protein n=1 Tax=Pomacea canaliculata TaxID=400727 RepID=A0A2T7PJS9_POMCA|nr:hypothetical protein C0Q70_04905 [Pomacea canaliculata]
MRLETQTRRRGRRIQGGTKEDERGRVRVRACCWAGGGFKALLQQWGRRPRRGAARKTADTNDSHRPRTAIRSSQLDEGGRPTSIAFSHHSRLNAFVPSLGISDNNDDAADDVALSRRGWSMMRLGRGLQMLRLGKRSHRLDSAQPLTPQDLAVALASSSDDSHGEFRRQPPLPRYGRELDLELEVPEELSQLRTMTPADLVRAVAALRGDRYKSLSRWRTTKAVPAPRIGRQEEDEQILAEARCA